MSVRSLFEPFAVAAFPLIRCTTTSREGAAGRRRVAWATTLLLSLLLGSATSTMAAVESGVRFDVTLPAENAPEATRRTGRLYVYVSTRTEAPVELTPSWFSPEPFYAIDVVDWEPGSARTIDDTATSFPDVPSKLPPGRYAAAAIFDTDFDYPNAPQGVGNRFSESAVFEVQADGATTLALTLDRIVPPTVWPESPHVKVIERRSDSLSEFHHRDVIDRAVVVLPASYDEQPERRYPTIYEVSGFGGHLPDMAARAARSAPAPAGPDEPEFIRVLLSGECKWGHHVYADSAINGPRGWALLNEMIPAIDAQFRTVHDSRARFVTGHSSGGWSSLWLQVRYPSSFGGVWSTSPDPVDFRDYQQTDLYADPPQSVYFQADGSPKPLARRGETPVVWYPDFGRLDDVLGRGGQLRSFEAVFSQPDEQGLPRKMWDRTTGKVDPETIADWSSYDISLRLRERWETDGPKLAGKLHVVMGSLDTFYLEGATILLKKELETLGSDASVEIIPGADHGSVLTREVRNRIRREMAEAYLKHFDLQGIARE